MGRRPLLPVKLGKRESSPSNEDAERVGVLLAFGEFTEELPASSGVVQEFPLALASRGKSYTYSYDLGSNMERDQRVDRVVPDIGERIGPPQNPEQIGGGFGRLFPTLWAGGFDRRT